MQFSFCEKNTKNLKVSLVLALSFFSIVMPFIFLSLTFGRI